MVVLFVLGGISLILGIIFIFSKESLKKLQEELNKIVIQTKEDISYKYHVLIGLVLIFLAAILFYIAWFFKK